VICFPDFRNLNRGGATRPLIFKNTIFYVLPKPPEKNVLGPFLLEKSGPEQGIEN